MMSLEDQNALAQMHPELKKIFTPQTPRMAGWKKGQDVVAGRNFLLNVRQQLDMMKKLNSDSSKNVWVEEDSEISIPDWSTVLPADASSISPPCKPKPGATVKLQIKIHKPKDMAKGETRPGIVVFCGGGYVLRDFTSAADLCHRFVSVCGGIAVDIGYRVAPEHAFPVPVRDCAESLLYVAQHAKEEFGIDTTKGFVVAGESSGADFAVVSALLYRQEQKVKGQLPSLTGVYASMPWCVNKETLPEDLMDRLISFTQCQKAPQTLDTESFEYCKQHYAPDSSSPLAFPLAFPGLKPDSVADVTGGDGGVEPLLPKTYIQVCGLDPVRDCGLCLEEVFRRNGIDTRLDVYPGLTHAHWFSFGNTSWASKALKDSEMALPWLLGQESKVATLNTAPKQPTMETKNAEGRSENNGVSIQKSNKNGKKKKKSGKKATA